MKLISFLRSSCAVAALLTAASAALGQGTVIHYQGRLNDGGSPANGAYDFKFTIFDAAADGSAVGSTLQVDDATVAEGLFGTDLDFGVGTFNGADRWLQIEVRPGASTGAFTALTPRTKLLPVPYSIFAAQAASVTVGAVGSSQLANGAVDSTKLATGAVDANALADGSVTASKIPDGTITDSKLATTYLTPGAAASAYQPLGNYLTLDGSGNGNTAGTLAAGQFNGSAAGLTDIPADQLTGEIPDTRLTANIPRLDADQALSGSNHFSGILVATNELNEIDGRISGNGGGLTNLSATGLSLGTIPDDRLSPNVPLLDSSSVFSGAVSFMPSTGAPFAVGNSTKVDSLNADLLDGLDSSAFARVDGSPAFAGDIASVRMNVGSGNSLSGTLSSISGGDENVIDGNLSIIAGGTLNQISGPENFIGGGHGSANISPAGGVIGGGAFHHLESYHSFIGGGYHNTLGTNSNGSAIVAGIDNYLAFAWSAAIGGGQNNVISNNTAYGVIAGGQGNQLVSDEAEDTFASTISGGQANMILNNADFGVIAGGDANVIASNSFGAVIGGGQLNHAWSTYSTINGGYENEASNIVATVGGGWQNKALGQDSTIAGGSGNQALGFRSVVSGGYQNAATNYAATVSGGQGNKVFAQYGGVSGGNYNTIETNAWGSHIGGGTVNVITGFGGSVIGGGIGNTVATNSCTIPGGSNAVARNWGQFAFASGTFDTFVGDNAIQNYPGQAQTSMYVERNVTTNLVSANLILSTFGDPIVLITNSVATFHSMVSALSSTGDAAGFEIKGVIQRNGDTTSLVGTPSVTTLGATSGAATWSVAAAADDADDALVINVTGSDGAVVRWVGRIVTSEVAF